MAIPTNSARVVYSGHLRNGEQFATGYWLSGEGIPTTGEQANGQAAIIAGVFDGFFGPGSPLDCLSTDSGYDRCNVYGYPNGGTVAEAVGEAPMIHAGASTVSILPNQACVTLTLRTGLAGRQNRGRMYVPANAAPMATDGQLTATFLNAFVTQWKAHLEAVQAALNLTKVVVVSKILGGHANPVTLVTADSRLDIQRRRANSENELRQASAVVEQ